MLIPYKAVSSFNDAPIKERLNHINDSFRISKRGKVCHPPIPMNLNKGTLGWGCDERGDGDITFPRVSAFCDICVLGAEQHHHQQQSVGNLVVSKVIQNPNKICWNNKITNWNLFSTPKQLGNNPNHRKENKTTILN